MNRTEKRRRRTLAATGLSVALGMSLLGCRDHDGPKVISSGKEVEAPGPGKQAINSDVVRQDLGTLVIKGRAPKTGYSREQFGEGWDSVKGCDTRNKILQRDLVNKTLAGNGCEVFSGFLQDPYTGTQISFVRGVGTSSAIQIDHVVALSDAWQKGAQQMTFEAREAFANDPLELLAVDGPANEKKGDADAASWLPPNKAFRCSYVAQQILVKEKYDLWVTSAEHDAMAGVLDDCPDQLLVVPQ